jgi:FKBP-type peptidyl-prolyl cis-trans isomerase 2
MKKVKVHYTLTLENGYVVDSSFRRDEPIEVELGVNKLIPGFEKTVKEMSVGDKKNVTLKPSEGYGEIREDLIREFDIRNVPEGVVVGQQLQATQDDGSVIITTVKEVNYEKGTVLLDSNFELAGKNLVFEIELLEIIE